MCKRSCVNGCPVTITKPKTFRRTPTPHTKTETTTTMTTTTWKTTTKTTTSRIAACEDGINDDDDDDDGGVFKRDEPSRFQNSFKNTEPLHSSQNEQ